MTRAAPRVAENSGHPDDVEKLTTQQVAVEYGIAESTLREWRIKGMGPNAMQLEPGVWRYRRSDIRAWEALGYERGVSR